MVNKKKLLKKEKTKKDKEWALAVKNKFNNHCALCARKDYLNAHHIIPREFAETRWDVMNGIAVCPVHHKLGNFSFHKNGLWAINVLKKKYPEMHDYLVDKICTIEIDRDHEALEKLEDEN